MWAGLRLAMICILLAVIAKGAANLEFVSQSSLVNHSVSQLEVDADSLKQELIELLKAQDLPRLAAEDQEKDIFPLPRGTGQSATMFSSESQTSPNYFLEVEFFQLALTAALFKHLFNPPLPVSWYEQQSYQTQSSRLSGWKDGNALYASSPIYPS